MSTVLLTPGTAYEESDEFTVPAGSAVTLFLVGPVGSKYPWPRGKPQGVSVTVEVLRKCSDNSFSASGYTMCAPARIDVLLVGGNYKLCRLAGTDGAGAAGVQMEPA